MKAKPQVQASATLAQEVAQAAANRNHLKEPQKPQAPPVLPARKNLPSTNLQEDRKQAFDKRRSPPSTKKVREEGLEKRQNRKRVEKLNKLRGVAANIPPDIPREIPVHKVDSPVSQCSKRTAGTAGFLETVSETETDMKQTVSEGEAVLNGLQLPKKKWKLNSEDWENLY